MDIKIDNIDEIKLLKQLGVDVFPSTRNYWFIRTQSGAYYEDFVYEGYVGIEWDEISDKDFIKNATVEEIKTEVIKYYPKTDKPGYPAKQILKFANDIKKGDIVLIPNEHSQWISFGRVLEDEMYIYEEEEDDFQSTLDKFYDDSDSKLEKPILKKRRRVEWIDQVKRVDLDPYLYSIIYSHSAVVDANPYSLFIDRTLSQFYIKGNEAYFTFRVNKKKNIPYTDTLKFLNNNNEVINFINKYSQELMIDPEELVLKINVQSKGPIQLKGKMTKVLYLGLVITALFGANLEFKLKGLEYSVETKGLPALLESVNKIMETSNDKKKQEEIEALVKSLTEDKQRLQLQLPAEGHEKASANETLKSVIVTDENDEK